MNHTPWLLLFIAGIFEVAWAIGLKYAEGFTRPWPSAVTILAMICSFYFLARSLKSLPVGTAYAVWTGIGAVGTAFLGIVLFEESRHAPRLLFISFIVVGIAGLKVTSPT